MSAGHRIVCAARGLRSRALVSGLIPRVGMLAGVMLAGVMLAFAAVQPAAAQINPFGEHPGGLTAAQQTTMKDAIHEALEAGTAGTAIQWQQGGVSGIASVRRVFQRDGMSCVTISHRFTDSDRAAYELPFCRTADGWKVYF